MQQELIYMLSRTEKNRVGTGGGDTDTAPKDISELVNLLRAEFGFDYKHYSIVSFRRSSPKPGYFYQYRV